MTEWNEGFPAEIKDHPSMKDFKSSEDLAKSWVNAQGMIGVDKIPVPKADDDANWPVVYNRLGRPEKVDGYKMGELKDLPEGFKVEEGNIKNYLDTAHKLGLSQKQAAGLFEYHVNSSKSEYSNKIKSSNDAQSVQDKALRVEMGQGYEANVALANKALAWATGGKSDDITKKYGNDPVIIKAFAKIGNELSEDLLGSGQPKPGDMTPKVALQQAQSMLSDPENAHYKALNNADHPEHKAAQEKYDGLFELAYGGNEDD